MGQTNDGLSLVSSAQVGININYLLLRSGEGWRCYSQG